MYTENVVNVGEKKKFTGRRKCLTSDLKCTELCQCFGQCTNARTCSPPYKIALYLQWAVCLQ